MKNKRLFAVAYWTMHLSPLYAVMMIVARGYGVPGWIALLPLCIVFLPAAAYIISVKCRHCGAPIYTTENLNKVPRGFRKIPLHRFNRCPKCNGQL